MDAAKADRGAGVCASLALLPGVALSKQQSMHVYSCFLLLQLVFPGTLPFLRAVPACPDAQLYRQVWKAIEEPLAARREALLTSQVWSPAVRKLVHTLPRMRFTSATPSDALYVVDPVMQDKFERDEIGKDGVQAALDEGKRLPVVPHGLDNKCGVCRIKRRHATVVLTFYGRRVHADGLWDDVNSANSSGHIVVATGAERRRALKRAQVARAKQRNSQKDALQQVLKAPADVSKDARSGASDAASSSGSDAESRPVSASAASAVKKATLAAAGSGGDDSADEGGTSVDSMDDVAAPGLHRKGTTLVIASKPPASSLWGAKVGKLPPSYAEVTVHDGWEAHIPRGVQTASLSALRKGVFQNDAQGTADVGNACYGVVPPESYSDSEDGNAYQGEVSEDDSASDYIEDVSALPKQLQKRRRHAAQDTGLEYIEAGVPRECMPRWVAAGGQCASRMRAYHAVHHFKYRMLCDISTRLHAFAIEASAAAVSAASVSFTASSLSSSTPSDEKAHAAIFDELFPLISSFLDSHDACVRLEEAARSVLQGFSPQTPDLHKPDPQGYRRRPATTPAVDFAELPQYALPPAPPTAFIWAFMASPVWKQIVNRWCGIHDTLSRIATAKYTSEMTRKQQRDQDEMLGEDWLDVLEDDVAAEILPLPCWAGTTALRPPFSGTEAYTSGPMPNKMPTYLSTETKQALGGEVVGVGAMRSEAFSFTRECLAAQAVCTVDTHEDIAEAAEATAINNDIDEVEAKLAVAQQARQLRKWSRDYAKHSKYRDKCRTARSRIVRGLAVSPAKQVLELSGSDSSSGESLDDFIQAKRTQSAAMSAQKRRARRHRLLRDSVDESRDSPQASARGSRRSRSLRPRGSPPLRSSAPSSSARKSFRKAERDLASAASAAGRADSVDSSGSDTDVDKHTPLKSLAHLSASPRRPTARQAARSPLRGAKHTASHSPSRAANRQLLSPQKHTSPRQRLSFSPLAVSAGGGSKRLRDLGTFSQDTLDDVGGGCVFDDEVSSAESNAPAAALSPSAAHTSAAKRPRQLHLHSINEPLVEVELGSTDTDSAAEAPAQPLPAARTPASHKSTPELQAGMGAVGLQLAEEATPPELQAGAGVQGLGDLTPGSGGRWEYVYE